MDERIRQRGSCPDSSHPKSKQCVERSKGYIDTSRPVAIRRRPSISPSRDDQFPDVGAVRKLPERKWTRTALCEAKGSPPSISLSPAPDFPDHESRCFLVCNSTTSLSFPPSFFSSSTGRNLVLLLILHHGCFHQGPQRQDQVQPDHQLHLLYSYVAPIPFFFLLQCSGGGGEGEGWFGSRSGTANEVQGESLV